jgi:hypothetical protein
VPENFRAFGRVSIDEFTAGPVVLKHLREDLTVGGRHIEVENAKAQFYGGTLDGSLDAELTATPVYRVTAEYSRVDLAALTAGSPSLASLFEGAASGDIALNFSGGSQSTLVSSLLCSGSAHVVDPEIRAFNLTETLREASLRPGASSFREAAASFTCADEKISFQDLSFEGESQKVQGAGIVNFDRTLSFQLSQAASSSREHGAKSSAEVPTNAIEVTGPLARPRIRRIETVASKP